MATIMPTVDPSTGFPILNRKAIDNVINQSASNPSFARSYGKNTMPASVYRNNYDKFGWNVKSDASSILRGRAIFGLDQGYTEADLIAASTTLGIPYENYYKTITERGRKQTVFDSQSLLKEIDKKTNGMYLVTNSIDGTNEHATVFYRDDGTGRLIPQKDAGGGAAATTFTAERNVKSNWYDLVLEAVRVGGPMIVSAYVTGNPNFTTTQQVAANAVANIAAGADAETVLRSVVGSVAASQVPQALKDVNVIAQADPILKSAVTNALTQATYSLVMPDADIALNAIAGALGGAATEFSKLAGVNDPLYQKTLGEYTKYRALGLSPKDAGFLAAADYTESVAAGGKNQPATEGIAAVSPKKGAQIGDPFAGVGSVDITVPSEIASLQQFKTMPGETGTNIYKVTEDDGIVTYQKIISGKMPDGSDFGYTIKFDPEMNSFSYEYSTGSPDTGNIQVISRKSRPVEGMPVEDVAKTLAPPRLTGLPAQRMPGADYGFPVTSGGVRAGAAAGADAGEGGTLPAVEVTAPVEETPTLSLLRRVRSGQEAAPDAAVRSLPEVEVIGQREPEETQILETQRPIQPAETEGERRVDDQEEPVAQRKPTESIILELISGGSAAQRAARQQRTPDEKELASMQALSQALRIGDPGEPLFGGRLGRRRNVWNVESLRLKDELGG